ncbi:phosphatase [Croceibacterium mercuriale]|uniref:Phosphatase n=1 Tax=Croceibacterium mercuriale TaxID=1572751 RepID=A0A0B2C210_9SPHN|nr:PhoX family phosphatase [Croceibacterium mercuriale]KHL26056.1 phosphatase [Croceibacterium mercuriale]
MDNQLDHRGYWDGDTDTNNMGSRSLESMAAERFSRRQTIMGSLQASVAAFLGTTLLAACRDDDDAVAPTVSAGQDATVSAGRTVTLTGSATGAGAAAWAQTGGPAVTLSGTGETVTFLSPGVAQNTPLTFTYGAAGGGVTATDSTVITVTPAQLAFTAVPKSQSDVVVVPAGYNVTVLTRTGDPIAAGVPAYRNDGTDTNFAQRIGDHHDALAYFGLNAAGNKDLASSTRGLIVQNHENINNQYLHVNGSTNVSTGPRPEGEAIKEIEAHGVSVTEIRDTGNRQWTWVQDSRYNRRLTPNTPTVMRGPARGSDLLRTAYSPAGTDGRGTINNCANGVSVWSTVVTCEENWAGYFRRPSSGAASDNANRSVGEQVSLRRYGVTSSTGSYAWSTVNSQNSIFRKWDARATAADATQDYRNEPNQYGWVVEFDQYNPASAPRKRTALGRFGHEGAWFGLPVAGRPIAVYMGDDSRGEYLYKFVSRENWLAADATASDPLAIGDKYLDQGTLYAARFNADGTGQWLPLVFGQTPNRPATGADPEYVFASQADICVNARLAGDAVRATPMDRPEWTGVNPANGEIYLTLTNSNATLRPISGTDAANPRHYNDPKGATEPVPDPATPPQPTNQYGNPNGHIIRLRETDDNGAGTTFRWDIYLFGADNVDADPVNVNISGLDDSNSFSSPDGLWFSRPTNPAGQGRPLMWLQTDDGAILDRTNNQMLACFPGRVGDGGARTITNRAQNGTTRQQATIVGANATPATVKRFLVGPQECELTGVDSTPDGRTLFAGIQHPGEAGDATRPTSNWPQSQAGTNSGRPRSGLVAITKADGGIVGI